MNLSTSIREPAEVANKIDLAFIRENFVPQRVSTIGWTPGYHNIADGMTKDNRTSAALLLRVFREGMHPNHPDTIRIAAEHPLDSEPRRSSNDYTRGTEARPCLDHDYLVQSGIDDARQVSTVHNINFAHEEEEYSGRRTVAKGGV